MIETKEPTSTGTLHYVFDADKPVHEWIPGNSDIEKIKELLKNLVWSGHEVTLVVSRPFSNHIRGTINRGYESFADQASKTYDELKLETIRHLELLGIKYYIHFTLFYNVVGPTGLEAEQMKARYIIGRHGKPFRA